MIDPQVAFDKLAQFESPDEIADYLRSEGIVGIKSARACPIANWMQRETGNVTGVTCFYINSYDQEAFVEAAFDPTNAMTEFISIFDSGLYPELRDFNYEEDRIQRSKARNGQ